MPNFQVKPRPEPVQPPIWDFSSDDSDKKVLAFSGKLHSGKSTCKNFLMSMAMTYSLGVLKDSFINEEGKIVGPYENDEYGVIDIDSKDAALQAYMNEKVWPFMKPFSCADYLKKFCVDVLKVPPDIIYGSQEDKKKLTAITWDKIPGYTGKRTGRLSGRDLLETFGTDVVRYMVSDGWAHALKNSILEYGSLHSIVDDVRFEDEIDELRSIDGKVIRLTLVTEESSKNTHISNCALDQYDKFDYVIQNDKMTMEDTFRELISVLTSWGWFKVVNQ